LAHIIGIVGLPKARMRTVFNALSSAQIAEATNYPFCSIQLNEAILPLPDDRLDRFARLIQAPKTIHATLARHIYRFSRVFSLPF
jgi:ribosome-binding ATPase